MRLASRELWVRVPVKIKSLSEKGGAVELNVVGVAGTEWQVASEEVSTIGRL